MRRYVFSDPHFDHEKIIEMANRPFHNVGEMNNTIIRRYNAVVGKQDVCYWLGDIMYNATKEKVQKVLSRMRGYKCLIMGNHDRNHSECWWKDCGFDKKPQLIIIGEDEDHLVEIFKDYMRVQADLEGIEVYYTTDLRQLDETLETSLIAFRLNQETGRYQKEVIQTPILSKS